MPLAPMIVSVAPPLVTKVSPLELMTKFTPLEVSMVPPPLASKAKVLPLNQY